MAECLGEYIPTQWVNGTAPAINAVNLNNIENGIRDVTECTRELEERVDIIEGTAFPIGSIIMLSGTEPIPSGWSICDGNNNTPDLIGKFVRGGITSGATGGNNDAVTIAHTHGVNIVTTHQGEHSHDIATFKQHDPSGASPISPAVTGSNVSAGVPRTDAAPNHQHGVHGTSDSTGGSGSGKNIPAYYTLIYIMKIA